VQYELVDDKTDELESTAQRLDSEPAVKGLLVLVAERTARDGDRIDTLATGMDTPVVGGVFPRLVHRGTVADEGVILCGLPAEPAVSTITGLGNPAADIQSQLDETPLENGDRTAVVFVDAYASRVEEFVRTLFDTYGVEFNFIGGGGGGLDSDVPSLVTPAGLRSEAAVVATLPTESTIGVQHGWQEIDGPFRVTESDGRTVTALDGDPALDVYSAAVADHSVHTVDPDDFFATAKHHPFGLSRMGRENIVRDPYDVTDDGALECFGAIPEGEFVHVLAGETDSLVDAARAAHEDAVSTGKPDRGPVVTFDCISRALFMDSSFDTELSAMGDDEQPAFGALTIGEIANDGHGHLEYYNKTAVIAQLHE
jgi:hypothetical protein